MRLASILLIALFVGLLASCGNKQDCPDITLVGGNPNCPEDTSWVCGCDDSTYINECVATNRGMYVTFKGKCEDKPAEEE
ncbi:MAG: hypothetical protein ACPGLV_19035 [Bacteroidia bacterium]